MKLILAGILTLTSVASVAAEQSHYVVMKDGKVDTYFGVPAALKISDLKTFPLPHKASEESVGEGITARTAIVSAKGQVEVVVVFDRRGDADMLKTDSPRAVDPMGIKVGDDLTDVKKAWPKGKLYYGHSIEGGQPYAVFHSGTNVVLRLTDNIADIKNAPAKVRVKEIQIVRFNASL